MEITIKRSKDAQLNNWDPHNKMMKEIKLKMNQE